MNKQEWTIRKVNTLQEVKKVEELGNIIWNECYAKTLTKEQIEYMLEKFQSEKAIQDQMDNQNYHYFLIYTKEVAVGYMAMQIGDNGVFLSKLYLLQEFRGGESTDLLFSFIQKFAQENDKNKIWLTVNKYNERAIKAYKKRGFVIVREQVADIGNNFIMDDYILEKAL